MTFAHVAMLHSLFQKNTSTSQLSITTTLQLEALKDILHANLQLCKHKKRMGLFKLPSTKSDRIPTAIEFIPQDVDDTDALTRITRTTDMEDDDEDEMTGRGVNSRANLNGGDGTRNDSFHSAGTAGTGGRGGVISNGGMVGRGVNSSRLSNYQLQQQQQQQQQYPPPPPRIQQPQAHPNLNEIMGGSIDQGANNTNSSNNNNRNKSASRNNNKALPKKNPFYDSDDDDNSAPLPPPPSKSNNQSKNPLAPAEIDRAQFDQAMQSYEQKLRNVDESKFMTFGDSDDDSDDDTPLSGIEEEISEGRLNKSAKSGKSGSNNNNLVAGLQKSSFKSKLFGGKKKGKGEGRGEKEAKIHRPAVDSDSEYQSDEYEDEEGSYISGEYDEEFDNANGSSNHQLNTATPNAPIGVPNGKGSQFTHRQLEDELYLYKLETLNLTDACRELAEQLDEAELKLESVQAQATFRIHALEAELQDGHVGMKSLVKMTSTEMDSRLDALRALGKTATIQAEKIKERDMELNAVDSRLRKTRREIKVLKRENKKVHDEKVYLKDRLEELEEVKVELEGSLARMVNEKESQQHALSKEESERMERIKSKLNETLEQVGFLKSQMEFKDKELEKLRGEVSRKEDEIEQVREELAMKGKLC